MTEQKGPEKSPGLLLTSHQLNSQNSGFPVFRFSGFPVFRFSGEQYLRAGSINKKPPGKPEGFSELFK